MQMKSMKIVNVVNFPFPTNPGEEQLKRAEERLSALGALQYDKVSRETKEG
jgi:HrpA-like RNA helicase